MRNPSLCQQWYMDQAAGACLRPLYGAWKLLDDIGKLKFCGFTVNPMAPTATDRASLVEGGIAYEAEQESMTKWAVLLVSLTFERLRHPLWHLEGLPGRFAALLSEDAMVVARCLGDLEKAYEAWSMALGKVGMMVVAAVEGSFMNKVVVFQILTMLSDDDFLVVSD